MQAGSSRTCCLRQGAGANAAKRAVGILESQRETIMNTFLAGLSLQAVSAILISIIRQVLMIRKPSERGSLRG